MRFARGFIFVLTTTFWCCRRRHWARESPSARRKRFCCRSGSARSLCGFQSCTSQLRLSFPPAPSTEDISASIPSLSCEESRRGEAFPGGRRYRQLHQSARLRARYDWPLRLRARDLFLFCAALRQQLSLPLSLDGEAEVRASNARRDDATSSRFPAKISGLRRRYPFLGMESPGRRKPRFRRLDVGVCSTATTRWWTRSRLPAIPTTCGGITPTCTFFAAKKKTRPRRFAGGSSIFYSSALNFHPSHDCERFPTRLLTNSERTAWPRRIVQVHFDRGAIRCSW